MSEKVDLSHEELVKWIRETILQGISYISVTNNGGCYARFEGNNYTVEKQKHVEQRTYSSKKKLIGIFEKLINKHQNFDRKGYSYYYDRGSWRRFRINGFS